MIRRSTRSPISTEVGAVRGLLVRGRSAGSRGALRVLRESRRQAHAPAPPGVWVQRPGLRPQGLPGTRLLPELAATRPASSGVGWRFDALRTPPTLGAPGLVKQGTRVPSSVSNGWELPVRRAWYGAYYGRRIKARPGRDRAWLGCRAFASCRRCEGSAANRPCRHALGGAQVPQRSLGQNPRQADDSIPPMRGRSVPGLACTHPGTRFARLVCPATSEVRAVSRPAIWRGPSPALRDAPT